MGTPRGSRGSVGGQLVEPRLQPRHHRRVGALLRPEHRRARARTACARRTGPRSGRRRGRRASSIAASAPAPPSVVAEPPTPTSTTCAPAAAGGADQLAGAVGRRRPGVALGLRHEAEPRGGGHLQHRGAAVLDERELRLHGAAERILDLDARPSRRRARAGAPPSCPRRRRRAGTGRAASARRARARGRSRRPPPAARNVPLNESGATRTGRSVIARILPAWVRSGPIPGTRND